MTRAEAQRAQIRWRNQRADFLAGEHVARELVEDVIEAQARATQAWTEANGVAEQIATAAEWTGRYQAAALLLALGAALWLLLFGGELIR